MSPLRFAPVLLLAALVVPHASASIVATIASGGGLVTAPSCGPVPAAIHLTLAQANAVGDWAVAIEGASCLGLAAEACTGTGSLGGGITVTGCLPLAGTGTLGPFHKLLAYCVGPCPNLAGGNVAFSTALGSFSGTVELVLEEA